MKTANPSAMPGFRAQLQKLEAEGSVLFRYALAVGLVATALIMQLSFRDIFVRVPFFLFWPTVIISASIGGLGPGLLATVLSVTAINYFFLSPTYTFSIHAEDAILASLFTFFSVYLSWFRRRQLRTQALYEQQKEELRITLASIGDGVITVDVDGRVTFLNAMAEQLTGWSQAEALGHPIGKIFNIVHEKTRAPVQIPALQALARRVNVGLANNTILIARDGAERYIADSGAPIVTESGEVIGAVLVFRDVTERYQVQREIARSREQYLSFITNSSEGIWRMELAPPVDTHLPVDEQIELFYQHAYLAECNDAMAQMYGFERAAEITGALLGDLLVRSDPANTEYLRAFVEANYRLQDAESHEVANDGTSRYFLNNLVGIVEDNRLVRAWGTQRDITERKLAEDRANILHTLTAALNETLTKEEAADVIVRTLLDGLGSSVGTIFVTSEDKQHLEMINRKGLPETTYQQYRIIPIGLPGPLTDAIHTRQAIWIESAEDYIARYPQYESNIRENGTQASVCLPFSVNERTIGGITISFDHRRVFQAEDRALLSAVAYLCAQTLERARLYEIEHRARQEAEEANRLKLQFLGMISHELRTPLTSIKGFSSTLLSDDITWEAESQEEFIRIIDQEADNLSELVETLLDLSRLQVGTLSISPQPEALPKIVESAKAGLLTLTHQHRLELAVPADLPKVLADGRRIAQVLSNLVSNASRYSPADTLIRLDVHQDGKFVQVDVTDEGEGIAPEAKEIVFEAFRQVERKSQNSAKGAGLGLAICKGLIEAHGGRIWITDGPERGTIVSFTLPVAAEG